MTDETVKPEPGAGLECPACGCPESRVAWVRRRRLTIGGEEVGRVVRARICAHCGHRFVTSERLTGGS